MHYIIFLLTALLACILGKICGMGGGVLIKPVLDAFGILPVAANGLLSSCTVLAMSGWSVGKSVLQHESQINWSISTPLAIGAALGGFAGKAAYSAVSSCFSNPDTSGGIQAALLFIATFATLIYTLKKEKISSYQVTNRVVCVLIGCVLGALGSFLGIGGGPFNMAVLFLFFSMSTKTAAQNSLYIILISQCTGLLKTLLSGNIPQVNLLLLFGMILFGIIGSEVGARFNKRLTERAATRLLEGSMLLVMVICIFNAIMFFR